MVRAGLSTTKWRTARHIAAMDSLQQTEFIDALAVFVRESRRIGSAMRIHPRCEGRREPDSSWIDDYYVGIHSSIICWVPDGKDGRNTERLTKQVVRCVSSWRGKANSRRDFVWLQPHPDEESFQARLEERDRGLLREIGQLEIIITVADRDRVDDKGRPLKYTGALVQRLRWRNQRKVHPVHGMFEVERIPASQSRNARNLGPSRFYEIRQVVRSAHVIPAGGEKPYFYVNNFVDWDQYNTIYDEEFLLDGLRVAHAHRVS